MPVPKRSSSIFNFSKKQLLLLKWAVLFFIPVTIVYGILEVMVLEIPMNYKIIGSHLKANADEIELAAFGSSQIKTAFNPALSTKMAINFASTSQHHNEDFHILKQTQKRLPKLKYILLEVSYNHFELPHHPSDYWKNTIYLKHYDVNAFERPTYFKDRLVYLSNPRFYSHKFMDYYYYKTDKVVLNEYGFDENNFDGDFKKMNYNKQKIAKNKFKIYTHEDLPVFETNTAFLYKILDYTKAENLKVIICTAPLYSTYLKKRNPAIVKRRDSVLSLIKRKYPNVSLLLKEEDSLNFSVTDFLDENHLNPDGAKKYTSLINAQIDNLH